jgi:uncharacterized membrane protein
MKKSVRWFPYFLFLVAGLGIGLTVLLHRIDLTIFSLTLVIPLILAAIILLAKRNVKSDRLVLPTYSGKISFSHLLLINIIIFIISIIILISDTTRPLAYFVLLSLYAGVVFIQILTQRPKWTDNLILLEIVFLSLNLIWGVSIKYPLYFGDTDTLGHLHMIDTILKTAHIDGLGIDYVHYPLYHIFTAVGIEITGMSAKTGLFIFMGLAWQVGIVFAFLLFKDLSNSIKFASIACLLFASSSPIIFYGSYAIARSLAFVFMMFWIYLVLNKAQRNTKYLFLSLIAMIAMIMTHHLNVLFVIPMLALIYLIQSIFMSRFLPYRLVNPLFVYLFGICCISYLLWVSSDLANSTLPGTIRELGNMDASLKSNVSGGYGFSVIIGLIYYSSALLLILLGVRIVFDHLNLSSSLLFAGVFALTGFVMTIVYVPGPLDLIRFSDIISTSRMQLMVSPFIAFLMAYGISFLYHMEGNFRYNVIRTSYSFILPAILIVTTAFFGTIGIGNAQDNDYFPHTSNFDTPYFTNSELASFSFLNDKGNGVLPLYSDYPTVRNSFSLSNFPVSNTLMGGDTSYIREGYILLRFGELQRKKALTFTSTESSKSGYRYKIDSQDTQSDILVNLRSRDRIYSDGYVAIFLAGRLAISKEISPTISN